MRVGAIIVAAGRGERLGGSIPKQLLNLGGRTMLERSVSAFDTHPRIDQIVVVLPNELVDRGADLVGPTTRPCLMVGGGARRQDSVANGLGAMPADVDVVLVHDAARPFADSALIDRVLAGVAETGAAVPAVAVRDTVKRMHVASRTVSETIPREEIWLAQTPQGFRRGVLADAVALAKSGLTATDEAMLAEQAGHAVAIVAGDDGNMKITTPDDLAAAVRRVEPAPLMRMMRIGAGYDLHRLVPGRTLVLAGVVLPSDRGPLGHSDGDVVCHALLDALFGAASAGDIGHHFPNTDPAWKDAAGLDLLAKGVTILSGLGWAPSNVDVTVVLEEPRVAPHLHAIRTNLARVLGIGTTHVSVKGKTNEGVDAVGRREAISAHAVAMLQPSTRHASGQP